MAKMIPLSEAKGRLSEVVRDSEDTDVLLMKHSTPAAVVMSFARHEALLEQIEDLMDRLSVHEREGVTVDFDKLKVELGLGD